jgi:hypothetical protein
MRKFYFERIAEILQTELHAAREGYCAELEQEFKKLNKKLQGQNLNQESEKDHKKYVTSLEKQNRDLIDQLDYLRSEFEIEL